MVTSSGRRNFFLQFATSSTPITDRGPTGESLSPPRGGGAFPTSAFLSSSISTVRSREDYEESMDSQASFPTLRLERTLVPIKDDPRARSSPFVILKGSELRMGRKKVLPERTKT